MFEPRRFVLVGGVVGILFVDVGSCVLVRDGVPMFDVGVLDHLVGDGVRIVAGEDMAAPWAGLGEGHAWLPGRSVKLERDASTPIVPWGGMKEAGMRGYSDKRDVVQQRLRRIEGQIRGLQRMVDEDSYCIDILTQVSAATRALEGVALLLLDEHLQHCVRDAIDAGGPAADAKIAEASAAIARLVKS